jgi:tetratricopeptide (TPR) repeat protein
MGIFDSFRKKKTEESPGTGLAVWIAHFCQAKLDEAVLEYREALRIDPDYDLAYVCLGNTCKSQAKHKGAIESYQTFTRLAPPQYASYIKQAEETTCELRQRI